MRLVSTALPSVLLGFLAGSLGLACEREPVETKARFDLRFELPEFALIEKSGAPVTRETLLGKVWIASFVFTRCTGPCPVITATMASQSSSMVSSYASVEVGRGPRSNSR